MSAGNKVASQARLQSLGRALSLAGGSPQEHGSDSGVDLLANGRASPSRQTEAPGGRRGQREEHPTGGKGWLGTGAIRRKGRGLGQWLMYSISVLASDYYGPWGKALH